MRRAKNPVGALLLSLITGLLVVGPAEAQPLTVRVEGPEDRVEAWRRDAEARGAAGLETLAPSAPHTPRSRVDVLSRVSDLLVRARAAAGNLAEDEALAHLARAREELEAHADVPGTSRWLAEVETSIGIVASHAGLGRLGDAALTRAASLDSTRSVRPGEATPTVVARAQELAAERATAPEGRFVVRADAPDAMVYLDDRRIGEAPVEVRAPVGRHVIRVEAPGRASWGRVVDVLVGRRLPMSVRLASTPRRRALRSLASVSTLREAAGLTAAADVRLWWIEVGDGPRERALLYECGPSGCSAPVRLERAWHEPGPPIPWETLSRSRRLAWRWLRTEPEIVTPPPAKPWRRRWQLWVPISAAIAAAAIGLGVGLRPDPPRQFQLSVDPSDLTPE